MQKVVILTALPLERKAVEAFLTDKKRSEHPTSGTIYYQGMFTAKNGAWDVTIIQAGMGNVSAGILAQQAIDYLKPEKLFLVGIAGGLKDVQPGDVVVANKVCQYASGKAGKDFYPRAQVALPAFRLVQRAQAVAGDDEWQGRILDAAALKLNPKAVVGAIAAGEQVLSSTDSATWRLLQQNYSDALAVEMEGYGTLGAAYTNPQVEAIVIRGISDTLDNKAELDQQIYQNLAAHHASAFAFEMLAQMSQPAAANIPQMGTPGQTVSTQGPTASSTDMPVSRTPDAPIRLFYSYAEDDKSLIDGLKKQLIVLRRTRQIDEWDFIQAPLNGANKADEWRKHLKSADIILLGISSNYVGSDEYDDLMSSGVMGEHTGTPIVIPLLLRKTYGFEELTGGLMALPRDKRKPIADNRAEILPEVAEEIAQVVKRLRRER